MQTFTRPRSNFTSSRRARRFSPLAIIGIIVTVLIIVGAGILFIIQPYMATHAAANNMDCAVTVPEHPLSAKGLATPYILTALDPAKGPCNEGNPTQSAFVQAAVIDPATGQISIYNPLVIDQNTQPAVVPTVPTLPQNAVVGIWFGFNGATLTLKGAKDSLDQGKCMNGTEGGIFGQFAYCNAPSFFRVANEAITAGKLTPPALGTARDGMSCPTVRDFSVVDQDQSDNVTTTYLVMANGQSAQMTAANMNALQNAHPQVNGSDNRLLDVALDGALGCMPWKASDLADPGQMVPALPLNELQAAAHQAQPVALVPAGDPMVLNNGKLDVNKLNTYRIGVDQLPAVDQNAASTNAYCQNLLNVAIPRLVLDAPFTIKGSSPDPAVGNTLFTFLAQRFVNAFGVDNLNCLMLLGKANPLATVQDNNAVAISVTLNGLAVNTNPTIIPTPLPTIAPTIVPTVVPTIVPTVAPGVTPTVVPTTVPTPVVPTPVPPTTITPNCNVNGVTVNGCMGTTTINGQTCTLTFMNGTVGVNCPTTPAATNMNPLTFNASGTSNDGDKVGANFDTLGNSYSAQALQNAGLASGQMVTFNGVTFFWPKAAAGTPDNVQVQGQVLAVSPVNGATTLAFLGAATLGPSRGIAVINYTDGSTQPFSLAFSDWTLNHSMSTPLATNQVVATTPYRNIRGGGREMHFPNVFYMDVPLQAGKTIKSVTLPGRADTGLLHIFAIGTK